jgi:transposase
MYTPAPWIVSKQEEVRRRRRWIQLYADTKDAGLVCRRCGISRPTLRMWWRRYKAEGEAGLVGPSRKPHHSPRRLVAAERVRLILALRDERKLGPKRIQGELLLYSLLLFSRTIN